MCVAAESVRIKWNFRTGYDHARDVSVLEVVTDVVKFHLHSHSAISRHEYATYIPYSYFLTANITSTASF